MIEEDEVRFVNQLDKEGKRYGLLLNKAIRGHQMSMVEMICGEDILVEPCETNVCHYLRSRC